MQWQIQGGAGGKKSKKINRRLKKNEAFIEHVPAIYLFILGGGGGGGGGASGSKVRTFQAAEINFV